MCCVREEEREKEGRAELNNAANVWNEGEKNSADKISQRRLLLALLALRSVALLCEMCFFVVLLLSKVAVSSTESTEKYQSSSKEPKNIIFLLLRCAPIAPSSSSVNIYKRCEKCGRDIFQGLLENRDGARSSLVCDLTHFISPPSLLPLHLHLHTCDT